MFQCHSLIFYCPRFLLAKQVFFVATTAFIAKRVGETSRELYMKHKLVNLSNGKVSFFSFFSFLNDETCDDKVSEGKVGAE